MFSPPVAASLFQILCFESFVLCLVVLADVVQFTVNRRWPTTHAGNPSLVSLARMRYIGSPGFFTSPYRFLHNTHTSCPNSWFQFGVRGQNVLAVFGEEARKAFLTNKNFNFLDGYCLLSPEIRKILPVDQKEGADGFGWFLRKFTRTDVIEPYIVHMISDISKDLDSWGSEGVMNPFVSLHKLVFQVAARISLGNELADNPADLGKAINAFDHLHKGSTPASLLLPWFPTPARIRRILAGFTLYRIVSKAVSSRKKTERVQQDILQTLLDDTGEQMSDMQITKLLVMCIFAASTNTGPTVSWLHIFLDQHLDWKEKVMHEVEAFVIEHRAKKSSLAIDLAEIPLQAWEDGLPSLELCLQETMRLTLIGILSRRNMGQDLALGDRIIRRGDFVVYMSEDVHLNGMVYEDPLCFNPGRRQSHASTQFGFLGWGAGNHPCPGQRFAKVMAKVISVLILSHFTLEGVDKNGRRLTEVPKVANELFKIGMPVQPVYFRYTALNLPSK